MSQAAAILTETDVARLLGLLSNADITTVIREIGRESGLSNGRYGWATYRGQADTFGPSLYQRVREGVSLTFRQIGAAKAILLQRNWRAVKDLVVRDVVRVTDAQIAQARSTGTQAPTYRARRSRSSGGSRRRGGRRRRAQAPAPQPAPQPVAVPQDAAEALQEAVNGQASTMAEAGTAPPPGGVVEAPRDEACMRAPYCSHGGPCSREALARAREAIIAARQAQAASVAQAKADAEQEEINRRLGIGVEDPSIVRFRHVAEELEDADGDFEPVTVPEDAGVARFATLDLD